MSLSPEKCTDHLRAAAAGAPLRPEVAGASQWVAALDPLLGLSARREMDAVVLALAAAFPGVNYLHYMAEVVRQTAGLTLSDGIEAFADDPGADYQLVRCSGSRATLVLFCGHVQRLGLHLNLIHRWLGRLGMNLIYLRDLSQRYYTTGLASIGPYPETLAALRERLGALGTEELHCYGNSGGGYGALKVGADLGARSILSLGGPTNLDPGFLVGHALTTPMATMLPACFDRAIDLGPAIRAMHPRPRLRIYHADRNANDRLHAENLRDVAEIRRVPDYEGHDVLRPIVMRGHYGEVLDWIAQR